MDCVPEFSPVISPSVVITPEVAPKKSPVRAPSLLKKSIIQATSAAQLATVETNSVIVSRHRDHALEREAKLPDKGYRRFV